MGGVLHRVQERTGTFHAWRLTRGSARTLKGEGAQLRVESSNAFQQGAFTRRPGTLHRNYRASGGAHPHRHLPAVKCDQQLSALRIADGVGGGHVLGRGHTIVLGELPQKSAGVSI